MYESDPKMNVFIVQIKWDLFVSLCQVTFYWRDTSLEI